MLFLQCLSLSYNDKEASATLNFNQLRKRVSAEDYFIDFKFECTSVLYITDHCVHIMYLIYMYVLM